MPCLPVKVIRYFGGTYYLHLHCRRVRQMESKQSKALESRQTVSLSTRRHMIEHRTLHRHRYVNLKSNTLYYYY
jgi:hypothetical protein